MDSETAYPNGELEEKILMKMPEYIEKSKKNWIKNPNQIILQYTVKKEKYRQI